MPTKDIEDHLQPSNISASLVRLFTRPCDTTFVPVFGSVALFHNDQSSLALSNFPELISLSNLDSSRAPTPALKLKLTKESNSF
jgi:hypothetical protein